VLPLVGALALLGAFWLSIKSFLPASSSYSSFDGMGGVFVIGAGSLIIGVVLMVLMRWRLPAFFAERAQSAAPHHHQNVDIGATVSSQPSVSA